MQLPRTFFFRLDCHQAAIAVGILELFYHVPFVFCLKFIYVMVFTSDVVRKDAKKVNEEEHLDKFASGLNVVAFLQTITIIVILLMLYAVLERKRWFMLPWFVFTIFGIGTLTLASLEVIEVLSMSMFSNFYTALFWWIAMFLTITGSEMYNFLAVYCSFREIGMANNSLTSTDASVQFHALDDSNVAGVV